MSRAAVLARGRIAAEAGMVDTCVIRRRSGDTTDPYSGVVTAAYVNPDPYSGKCRLRQVQALPETHDVGEDYVVLSRLQLQLPVSAVGLQVGDEVTVTASAHDPDLPGKVFLIRGPAVGSEITARRFEVTERTG
jgi:hypothetical protein